MPQDEVTTLEFNIHFSKGRKGRQQLLIGKQPVEAPIPQGRVPRISKLMALAISMENMILRGEVKNYAELAMLGHVSRARITQIMNYLCLAPDIQEEILHLSRVDGGTVPIRARALHPILEESEWSQQRTLWTKLKHR